ncbi:hypothetical protein [Ancylomarina sp. 16SWW S1-10-2]|uniref:hypothetical protein n=1 Tax=Ancylomarina sp. 16SWW S1-10-2 TaxID=2499681 RepID=UPI0012ADF4FF|nr:hypothetical protein [Ancylomarina sp. 16SWW S1-10-2]MRT94524.1 hypothetical protein [Ancylomarina sp. 16SWW S1-10-2]
MKHFYIQFSLLILLLTLSGSVLGENYSGDYNPKGDVTVDSKCVVGGNMTMSGEHKLKVKENGILIVYGNLTMSSEGELKIDKNGMLIVFGTLIMGKKVDVTIDEKHGNTGYLIAENIYVPDQKKADFKKGDDSNVYIDIVTDDFSSTLPTVLQDGGHSVISALEAKAPDVWDVYANAAEVVVTIAPIADVVDNASTTTVCTRVSSSMDDVEERDGEISASSSDIELVKDDGRDQIIGLRYTSLGIPSGATISNAFIQFTTDEISTGTCSLTIVGEDIDNSPVFTRTNNDVSNRTATTASVNWSPPNWTIVGESGANQKTPDLTTIIQEIINRPGYSFGNSISLIITGMGERTAESFDGSSSSAAQLCVTYTSSTAATCESIASSINVVEENGNDGTISTSSSDIELVNDGSRGDQIIGLRYTSLGIPSGVTISNAFLQFTTDEINTGACSLTIVGEDIGNSPAFTTTINDVSKRTATTASVNWSPPKWTIVGESGANQKTPDLTTIIQEIINRPGYSSGNSISLIITGTGERTAEIDPSLCVEYLNTPSVETLDTDGDGIIDSDDLDDDNDGILDVDEYRQVQADPFSVVNGNSEVFELPSASEGFTIDITSLDNSFNMIINGVKLVPGELQFQRNAIDDTDSFVRFESDNADFGYSGVSQVYNLNTSKDPSIISVQITIDATGNISFKGIRTPTSELENLIIDSSYPQFNTITWNATGTNTVQISQKVDGPTYLYATGSGISRLNDTDNDGIADSKDTDSDNDGCPDATEGANKLATTGTLTGGSNGGSSGNLGTVSNDNGIPLPLGTVNGTETTGQARTAAVATSETVTIVSITANTTLPICEGTDISFTANASGFRVTDFGSTGAITDDTTMFLDADGTVTSGDTSDDLIYNWYLNSNTVSIANTRTLSLSAVTNAMNGNKYRVEVSGPNISSCPVEEMVTLSVSPTPKPIGVFFDE